MCKCVAVEQSIAVEQTRYATKCVAVEDRRYAAGMADTQGRIKGETTGAIAPGLPFEGGPRDESYLF